MEQHKIGTSFKHKTTKDIWKIYNYLTYDNNGKEIHNGYFLENDKEERIHADNKYLARWFEEEK